MVTSSNLINNMFITLLGMFTKKLVLLLTFKLLIKLHVQMKKNYFLSLCFLLFLTAGYSQIIINELDADTAGTDTMEFLELYDGGVGNTALDGLVLVLYNGSNNLSYNAIDLDGFTTDADGYFVIGNAAVPNVSIVIPSNGLQNGADAVGLYTGDGTGFPNGSAVSMVDLIDALVYDTNDSDDPELLVLLITGESQVNEAGAGDKDAHSSQRVPNGSGGARNTAKAGQLGDDNQSKQLQTTFAPTGSGMGNRGAVLQGFPTVLGPGNLPVVVMINKTDKPAARPHWAVDQVFDLFVQLDASHDLLDFHVLYGSSRDGHASVDPDVQGTTMMPLLDAIIENVNTGGIVLVDNVLWSGKVILEPDENDIDTKAIIAFNEKVRSDKRVKSLLLPIRDGLSMLRKL